MRPIAPMMFRLPENRGCLIHHTQVQTALNGLNPRVVFLVLSGLKFHLPILDSP